MTRPAAETALAWGTIARLAAGLGTVGRIGNAGLFALLVVVLTMMGFIGMAADPQFGRAGRAGLIYFVLMVFYLRLATGMLNKGWRVLPVSDRERRAAAWVLVALVPLALDLLTTLLDYGLVVLVDHHAQPRQALAEFGLRGLIMEVYALVGICFGNWPASASSLWQAGRRDLRDWLMYGVMMAIAIATIVGGDWLTALPGASVITTMLALAICALALPAALRVIRLDHRRSDAGMFDGLADALQGLLHLRLSGWSGHLSREALRTAMLWLGMVIIATGIRATLPAPTGGGAHAAAFRAGFVQGVTFGTASNVWLMPAMAGALISVIGQQYLLRARLMLLTLPRGDWLVLVTPGFNAALAFAATLVLVWPYTTGEADLGVKLLAGALFALAFTQIALALNLGVTSYAGLLRNGLVTGIGVGGIGFSSAVSAMWHGGSTLSPVGLGVTSLVVLIAALAWSQRQLQRSRGPYRPWPGAAGTWRAA